MRRALSSPPLLPRSVLTQNILDFRFNSGSSEYSMKTQALIDAIKSEYIITEYWSRRTSALNF
jgi:hypothetical protein